MYEYSEYKYKESILNAQMQSFDEMVVFSGAAIQHSLEVQLLNQLETQLQKVTEAQLLEFAVEATHKRQTVPWADEMLVWGSTLSWKQVVFMLFTAKNRRPRTFKSLDRRLRYLPTQANHSTQLLM